MDFGKRKGAENRQTTESEEEKFAGGEDDPAELMIRKRILQHKHINKET